MSKHTKGPWEFDGICNVIAGKVGICQVEEADLIGWNLRFRDDSEANARLIAAAPELLEALEMAGQSAGFQYMTHETREAISSAIAKARGEA